MARVASSPTQMTKPTFIPPLQDGDHLTVEEFEHRYENMPELKRADLIDGIVHFDPYMPLSRHGEGVGSLVCWLGAYRAYTPGLEGGLNPTLRLRIGVHQPQTDACLRIRPDWGGRSATKDGFTVGGVELAGEVAANRNSIELREKLVAYEQNGVLEYIVWRMEDKEIDWFQLKRGKYQRLAKTKDGVYKSKVFPGLWLDPQALIAGDLIRVLEIVQQGIASPEHQRFVARLQAKKK